MILTQKVVIWGVGGLMKELMYVSRCVDGGGADALDGHSTVYLKGLILFQHDIDVLIEAKTVLIFI